MRREDINKDIRIFLNSQEFKKTDVDLMGNALSTIILYVNPKDIKLKNAVRALISALISTTQTFEQKGQGEILTCFTPSYGNRKDYEKDIRNVLGTMEGYTATFPLQKRKLCLKRVLNAFLIVSWLHSLKKMNESFSFKLYCCAHMLWGYIYRKELNDHLDKNSNIPKLVVTFCDVHVCDYFVTEHYNKKGIPTATLQHAVFDHINTGYANSFSMSKYFLGISEFGKSEYIKSGKDGNNYVVLGSLKYIGKCLNEKMVYNNTGKFGIALSGVAFQNQNKTIIEFAEKLAKDYSYTGLIRCHPALNPDEYRKIIDSTCMEIDRSESLDVFADKCDFCIMGSTNTFGDLISNGHLALRMIFDADVFEGIKYFKFTNYAELREEVNKIKTDIDEVESQFDSVKNQVCAPGNIEENYRNYFKNILEKIKK